MTVLSEVVPGVHRLDTAVTGTNMPLALYLVGGGSDEWLLTDTGCRDQVSSLVLPALAGLAPAARVGTGVICHAHADHFGGNAELLAANPGCRLLAHEADAAWARDPDWHIADAYGALAPDFVTSEADRAWLRGLLGPPTPVGAVRDGDVVAVGSRRLEVVHLPGHSPGHIGLWDEGEGLLLASDAVLGDGQYAGGELAGVPSYLDVGWYLGSIERIRRLAPRVLATAHFPVMRGAEVAAFLDLSERFVAGLAAGVEAALGGGEPRSLASVTAGAMRAVAPTLAPSYTAALSVRAHLEEMRGRRAAVEGMNGWSRT